MGIGGSPGHPGASATGRVAGASWLVALAVAAAAGCTRSVAVTPPEGLTPAALQACHALAAALPDQLDPIGGRRTVTPSSQLTAAWGDPPAGLRCGVPTPGALTPTATLVTVNGIDWFPEELTDGYMMTTVGRVADVELTVPKGKGPAPSMAAALSGVISATIPVAAAG
jgi:hypothetical protein